MQVENCKKTTYPPVMQIPIFRACSETMASAVQMSSEADTAPVCSTPEYFTWVEFLGKWAEHLCGDAFWKLQKTDLSHNGNIDFRACLQVIASSVEKSTWPDTLPVCSMLEYFTWVEFLRKWPQHVRGDAFWKLTKIMFHVMGDRKSKVHKIISKIWKKKLFENNFFFSSNSWTWNFNTQLLYCILLGKYFSQRR